MFKPVENVHRLREYGLAGLLWYKPPEEPAATPSTNSPTTWSCLDDDTLRVLLSSYYILLED